MKTNQIDNIGLDIGFGVVKIVSPQAEFAIPSVCGQAPNVRFDAQKLTEKYPGDQIQDDQGDWFVGDLALSQIPAATLLKLRARTTDESAVLDSFSNSFRLRMMKVAIARLYPNLIEGAVVHARIATGLPVKFMGDTESLKTVLIGQHFIRTDQTEFVLNVTEVMVMPQPYGTLYNQALTADGQINPCHTAIRTGTVDVGTYTVDATEDESLEYIESGSDSIEAGTHTAQEYISKWYSDKYGQTPTYRQIETALMTGCIKVRGESIEISSVVKDALKPLRSATIALITRLWQAGTNIDVIYVTGGGAKLVFDEIKAIFPQAVLVENFQFANARGYLNYALS